MALSLHIGIPENLFFTGSFHTGDKWKPTRSIARPLRHGTLLQRKSLQAATNDMNKTLTGLPLDVETLMMKWMTTPPHYVGNLLRLDQTSQPLATLTEKGNDVGPVQVSVIRSALGWLTPARQVGLVHGQATLPHTHKIPRLSHYFQLLPSRQLRIVWDP
jgi:hypothetical protein